MKWKRKNCLICATARQMCIVCKSRSVLVSGWLSNETAMWTSVATLAFWSFLHFTFSLWLWANFKAREALFAENCMRLNIVRTSYLLNYNAERSPSMRYFGGEMCWKNPIFMMCLRMVWIVLKKTVIHSLRFVCVCVCV